MAARDQSGKHDEQPQRDRRKAESWQGPARAEQDRRGADNNEPQAGFGGYGAQGGGYGSQSSYASHGGYGSEGQASHSAAGDQPGESVENRPSSQGRDTQERLGSDVGYGPQGDAHWPEANWGPMSDAATSTGGEQLADSKSTPKRERK